LTRVSHDARKSSPIRYRPDALDGFQRMSEELWKSLARFDGRCSTRTWCYMIARHTAIYIRTQPRHAHEQLVSSIPSIQQAATEMFSRSLVERAHQHEILAEAKEALGPDDRTLLVLRIDRNLSWREIATVLFLAGFDSEAWPRRPQRPTCHLDKPSLG
jgi:RNA polymerase sigma-70 factor (ECF subfamily)